MGYAYPFTVEINNLFRRPNYKNLQGSFSKFDGAFRIIVNSIINKGFDPLFIFIDDLDRASPNMVVETFEAINLLLETDHCVFFIGMDSKVIAANIEAKYDQIKKKIDGDSTDLSFGYKFLEKLIQINFRLPKANQDRLDHFIERNLLNEIDSESGENQEGTKKSISSNNAESDNRTDIEELLSRIKERKRRIRKFEDSDDIGKAVKLVLPYLNANPRLIKRFINLFRLKVYIVINRDLIETDHINIYNLARVILIEILYPEVLDDPSGLLEDFTEIKIAYQDSDIKGHEDIKYHLLVEDYSISYLYRKEFFFDLVMYLREHDLSDYLFLS